MSTPIEGQDLPVRGVLSSTPCTACGPLYPALFLLIFTLPCTTRSPACASIGATGLDPPSIASCICIALPFFFRPLLHCRFLRPFLSRPVQPVDSCPLSLFCLLGVLSVADAAVFLHYFLHLTPTLDIHPRQCRFISERERKKKEDPDRELLVIEHLQGSICIFVFQSDWCSRRPCSPYPCS